MGGGSALQPFHVAPRGRLAPPAALPATQWPRPPRGSRSVCMRGPTVLHGQCSVNGCLSEAELAVVSMDDCPGADV